jgi:hypothetical protein
MLRDEQLKVRLNVKEMERLEAYARESHHAIRGGDDPRLH